MPKISVITVCYNEPEVKRTCNSILEQTCKNYEWLVIDGGSAGKCIETLREFADKMTLFVSEKDNGIYDAMNKGIARARGEYLIFMNAGDVFFHPEILRLIEPYLNGENEVVYGDTQYINEDGSSEIVSCPNSLSKEFFIGNTINHQSAFIRRSLLHGSAVMMKNFRFLPMWKNGWFIKKTAAVSNICPLSWPDSIVPAFPAVIPKAIMPNGTACMKNILTPIF